MSGNIASRYIGGVPYGPGRSVGLYPNVASAGTTPGVTANLPVVQQRPVDTSGMVTPISSGGRAATTAATGGGSTGGGSGNLLASLLLGALSYGPDVYNYLEKQFAEDPQAVAAGDVGPNLAALADRGFSSGQDIAMARALDQAGITSGPATDWIRNGGNYTGAFEPGTLQQVPGGAENILNAPMGDPAFQVQPQSFYGVDPASLGSGADAGAGAAGADLAGVAGGATNWAGVPLEATQVSDMGLGTVGGADIATGIAYAPAAIFARGTSSFAKPGGEMGAQIGSALGGIVGGAVLGPWGAAAGTIAGGAIGGQIGPNPTIGGNFSSIGTFDGSGGLNWGNAGGDNGSNGNDASSFANWFAPQLQQQAAQQGYGFNPNMGGAQIRVGGYDNPSRSGQAPAGGYFYDITNAGGGFGGDPDRYALRSSDQFANNPYSPDQASAFTQNVLADLIARGVYTQGGQPGQDQAYLGSTLGANYGWYGAPGDLYSQTEYGGTGGFGDILQGRQNAITGYVNQNRLQQQANGGAQTVLGDAYLGGGYDPTAGWAQWGQDVSNGGQAPVNWMTDPAAMAAANWGVGVPGNIGPVQADGGA